MKKHYNRDVSFGVSSTRKEAVIEDIKSDKTVDAYFTEDEHNIYGDVVRVRVCLKYNAHKKKLAEREISEKNLLQKKCFWSILLTLKWIIDDDM